MISILIVDDQDLVREGLRMLLDAEPDLSVTGEAANGKHALTQARNLNPDVILMDVRMPELDGIQATTQLIRSGCRARILMLTTFNLDEYVYRAMKAGASGFLLKDASREQLTSAVRTVATGEALLAPAITRRLIEDFCRGPEPGSAASSTAGRLSQRELDVVRLVAQGMTNAEIAARLYLSETTIKSHIAHTLAKLGHHWRKPGVCSGTRTDRRTSQRGKPSTWTATTPRLGSSTAFMRASIVRRYW